MVEIPDLNSQNMKYFFMIATMLAIACFFLSETKGEMFASGAAISLGIALFFLAIAKNK